MQIAQTDIEAIAAIVVRKLTPLMTKKRWLSLKEASAEFTIGEHRLKHMGKLGIVRGFRDPDSKRGDWIFDRHSLDTYRERQAASRGPGIDEKILALKADLGL